METSRTAWSAGFRGMVGIYSFFFLERGGSSGRVTETGDRVIYGTAKKNGEAHSFRGPFTEPRLPAAELRNGLLLLRRRQRDPPSVKKKQGNKPIRQTKRQKGSAAGKRYAL